MAASSGPTQALKRMTVPMVARGHEVSVAFLEGRLPGQDTIGTGEVEMLGFPVSGLTYWGYSPALARYLDQCLAGYDIAHMHSLWLYPNRALSTCAHRKGVPYIVRPAGSLEPHCLGISRWKKALYYRLAEKSVLDRAACIHAASGQEAANIRAVHPRAPISVIPNGLDLAQFQDLPDKQVAREQLGLPGDVPVLLFLSRIHPKKGLPLLGEIFAEVLKQHADALLVVVGPDDHGYADSIKREYAARGIEGRVRFLGERVDAEKIAAYVAADIFVLPTHSENFGIVIAEALAAGTPTLVSDQAPWQALDEHRAGSCLPLEVPRFVEAILALLENPDQAAEAGARGRDWMHHSFSGAGVCASLEQLYTAVINQQSLPFAHST